MRFWLADSGIDIRTIGLFAAVSMPYALKFLWAPLLDRIRPPWIAGRAGRRRGWGLLIQSSLAAALLGLGHSDPRSAPGATAMLAVLVAVLSASQDIVIDALRIEMLDEAEYAIGGAIAGVGYRMGMLAAGGGALYIAQFADWHIAYNAMAALIGIGLAGLVLAPEKHDMLPVADNIEEWLRQAVVAPLANFARRPGWGTILAFVVTYKLGPVLALSLTSPFYHDMGFSKGEVASVTKLFGMVATLTGGFVGAAVVRWIGIWRTLWWAGVAQCAALYCFCLLALAGHSIPVLMLAIGSENVTGAVAATAFGTYLAMLCDKRFTATQFALLTACAALSSETLAAGTGYVSAWAGWKTFFLVMPLTSLPGLLLLLGLRRTMTGRGTGSTLGDPDRQRQGPKNPVG